MANGIFTPGSLEEFDAVVVVVAAANVAVIQFANTCYGMEKQPYVCVYQQFKIHLGNG